MVEESEDSREPAQQRQVILRLSWILFEFFELKSKLEKQAVVCYIIPDNVTLLLTNEQIQSAIKWEHEYRLKHLKNEKTNLLCCYPVDKIIQVLLDSTGPFARWMNVLLVIYGGASPVNSGKESHSIYVNILGLIFQVAIHYNQL